MTTKASLARCPGGLVATAVFVAAGIVLGCSAITTQRGVLPERNTVTYDQLVIHSDLEMPSSHRLLDDLRQLRGDLSQTLALPMSDEPIHVYLFGTEQSFDEFMRRAYPKFPTRRAFFVESDTRLAVFAYWGDRVAEDLRHETAHGYMHSVVQNMPLWLDEGLAEYFEMPRGNRGLNRPHAEQLLTMLLSQGWRPNLARLESLSSVGEMRQEDYAESWAWIHWMLESDPELRLLLQQYLQSLRIQAIYVPLSAVVKSRVPEAEHSLCEHLYRLGGRQ
jgi:hypothetical protein